MKAMALVRKLQAARAYRVRDWHSFERLIPAAPGVYRFTNADGLRVYVGQASDLRVRLRYQVASARIDNPGWTPNPSVGGVNLVNKVAKDQRDGRGWSSYKIDPSDPTEIEALNATLDAIDGLSVQWVECQDGKNKRERVEHLADRCVFDGRCRCRS